MNSKIKTSWMELLISAVYCYRANILNNDASPKHKLAEGTGFQRPQENCLRTQWRCVALAGGESHSLEVCRTPLTFPFVSPFPEILTSCMEELESFRFFVFIFHFMPQMI